MLKGVYYGTHFSSDWKHTLDCLMTQKLLNKLCSQFVYGLPGSENLEFNKLFCFWPIYFSTWSWSSFELPTLSSPMAWELPLLWSAFSFSLSTWHVEGKQYFKGKSSAQVCLLLMDAQTSTNHYIVLKPERTSQPIGLSLFLTETSPYNWKVLMSGIHFTLEDQYKPKR